MKKEAVLEKNSCSASWYLKKTLLASDNLKMSNKHYIELA